MTNKLESNNLLNLVVTILKVAIGILYVVGGVYVIKKQWFLIDLNEFGSWAFAILLVAYGIFRIQRAIKFYINN